MPVAFNPPPFPTADTTIAAPVDANADASIPADAFAQLLVAAGGDAPMATDARDPVGKGRLAALRGFADASLRLAADGKSAAALLGGRDIAQGLDADAAAGTDDPRVRGDDELPVDAASIAAALNAAIGAAPKADGPTEVDVRGAPKAGASDEPTDGRASADAPLEAIGTAPGEIGMPAVAAQVDARGTPATPGVQSRNDKAEPAERGVKADIARIGETQRTASPASAAVAAASPVDRKDVPHAATQNLKAAKADLQADTRSDAIVPGAIPVPASDASNAAATAKELLGDSVAKLKEALERSGSAVSAQALASAQPASNAAPANVQTIETPIGQPGFQDEFAGKLSQVVMLKQDRAEFHLHPAELGPVDVQISFASDQAVVLITAPQAATRDALEQTLPQLRDMLADQGITLGQATVQGERNPGEQGNADRGDDRGSAGTGSSRAAPEIAVRPARIRGLVDTYA